MREQQFKDRDTDRRVVIGLLVGLVLLFGGLYVAGYVFTSDKVPRGTTVAGVSIGGMTPAAARTTLEQELGPRAEERVIVSADGQRASFAPAESGLTVDYDASVEQAGGGRSWSPARMWDYLTGGDDLDAVLAVDEAELGAAIEKFAKKIDEPAVEGAVSFQKGRAVERTAEPGQEIDRDGAITTLTDSFLEQTDGAVPLPVADVEPEITQDTVRTAMEEFARPAMSAPVTLLLDDESVVVRPRAFGRALSMVADDGELVPEVDQKKLVRAIQRSEDSLALEPVPATVRLVNGSPKVVPGKAGVSFDPKVVTEAFPSLLVQERGARTLEVDAIVKKPDFTVRDARNLNITEVVSSFTTQFPHSDYRNTNLGRAAQLVNGTVLKPGETFSLNGTVGERTRENGFTEGFIISDGIYKEDLGGGVSQVATTLFNAAFFAGLEDVEHKPHSFYIDRYPIGREATVAWGAVDLRFRNDTPHGVLIQSWIDPSSPSSSGEMHVQMWSTKHWDITTRTSERYNLTEEETRYVEDEDCTPNDGYGGFDIDVFRIFRKPGSDEVVRRETMRTTYTPSDTVICGKDPNA